MIAEVRIECPCRDNLNAAAQNFLEVKDKTGRKPRACRLSNINEKVNIAIRPGLTAYR